MSDNQIVDSSFTAIINAPINTIDIPAWCFSLPEREYQGCSPAHLAAGFTTAPDGKRMSINVEIIGGSLMVQHYVETVGYKDHLILDSISDVFTPSGRDLAVLEKSDRSNLIYPMFAYAGSKRLFAEIRKDGRTA
jgi:hypothetical protein